MADTMQGLRRTCLCGEVTLEMGEVVVGGFTQRVRDKGSLIFIDLRDKSGIVQLVFDETTDKSVSKGRERPLRVCSSRKGNSTRTRERKHRDKDRRR